MRLPNGYGTVYKLSGKRRNPYIVRKTIGWTPKGKQIIETIGTYDSRQKALEALAEYNKNPFDISASKATFAEIYEKWSEKKYNEIAHSNALGYMTCYKDCEQIKDMRFADLRKSHLQGVIDNSNKNYPSKKKLKSLLNQLCKYALENDIISKDYSQFVEIGSKSEHKIKREPFSDIEIQTLWENVDKLDFIDTILIMIYTGIRAGELITIELSNIHYEERYMIGGIKTEAGKDRMIPLNKKILPFIKKALDNNNKYLVENFKGEQMKYSNYKREKFENIMEQLQMTHNPHDCRHTCATLLDRNGANKLSIKRILGHSSQDVTDGVYTHKNLQDLLEAIDKI
jgi:integrase